MTSIPASRRARAITLAPRSWPSRPGLATRTRIFRSAGISKLRFSICESANTIKSTRNSFMNKNDELCDGVYLTQIILHKSQIENRKSDFNFTIHTPPQIPRRHRAIRMPALRQLFHGRWRGQLAFPVRPLNGRAYAIVARWQHVRPLQGEDQEHMCRPLSDAFDLGESGNDRFI